MVRKTVNKLHIQETIAKEHLAWSYLANVGEIPEKREEAKEIVEVLERLYLLILGESIEPFLEEWSK